MAFSKDPEELPVSALKLPGSGSRGRIGVLVLHGFLGSPISIEPWARGLHEADFTVSAPRLAGHGSSWQELNETTWQDWYESAEQAFLELKAQCESIFVAGFSMGGALALRLAEIRGSEIDGVIALNPSIGDDRLIFKAIPLLKYLVPTVKNGPSDIAKPGAPAHIYDRTPLRALDSLRALWRRVRPDLYLVDLPLMVAYSENDHTVNPKWAQYVLDNVYSPTVRELIFERSFHNVSLDYDAPELIAESIAFIEDVLTGALDDVAAEDFTDDELDDEAELINAEFESIVSHLNLDQSTGTTYLDELDARAEAERFIPPNPRIEPTDQRGRWAIAGLVGGPIYLLVEGLTGFDLFGFGPWPGICAFIGGVVMAIYKAAKPSTDGDDYDDGAVI